MNVKEVVVIIAVSSSGQDLDSAVDPRFGRAQYFLVYNTETDKYQVLDNTQNSNAAQGAGVQTAQVIARQKAEMVISGNLGPKAYTTLNAAGIKIALWSQGTVREAIELAKNNKLPFTNGANVQSHW